MKAKRILREDEIETPLRLTVQRAGLLKAGAGGFAILDRYDCANQIDNGVLRAIEQALGSILNGVGPLEEFFFRMAVAHLAGPVDVQERAANVMVADLDRSLTLIRHVTIRAGDAAAGVNPLIP